MIMACAGRISHGSHWFVTETPWEQFCGIEREIIENDMVLKKPKLQNNKLKISSICIVVPHEDGIHKTATFEGLCRSHEEFQPAILASVQTCRLTPVWYSAEG